MKDFYKIKPNKEFIERTRHIYMESFKSKFPQPQNARHGARSFALGFAGGISLMLVISSSAVYANQNDVGPNNFLYPMKRAYESVSLGIADKTEKPLIQMELAERRLHEIEQINLENTESQKTEKLLKDMQVSVEKSSAVFDSASSTSQDAKENELTASTTSQQIETQQINALSAPINDSTKTSSTQKTSTDIKEKERQIKIENKENENRTAVCESLNNFFEHDSSYLGTLSQKNPELFEKFKNNCKPLIGEEKTRQTEKIQQKNIQKAEESRKRAENNTDESDKNDD